MHKRHACPAAPCRPHQVTSPTLPTSRGPPHRGYLQCSTRLPAPSSRTRTKRFGTGGAVQCSAVRLGRSRATSLAGRAPACKKKKKSPAAQTEPPCWFLGTFPGRRVTRNERQPASSCHGTWGTGHGLRHVDRSPSTGFFCFIVSITLSEVRNYLLGGRGTYHTRFLSIFIFYFLLIYFSCFFSCR